MASATSRGSPRMRVMPAVSMATSVPVAIAMPTSAAASAGASLMPSPTIATTSPAARNSCTMVALSPGSTSARKSAMPSSRATASALPRLSPLSMTVFTPSACRRATAWRAAGLTVSPKASRPSSSVLSPRCCSSHETVRPWASSSAAACASAPALAPRSPSKRLLPSASCMSCTPPSTPRPGRACTSRAGGTASPALRAATSTACASGCSLPCCSAAASRNTSSRPCPAAACTATSVGRPSVRVPVLSKATVVTACASSSACASLIRMPCCAATPVPAMMAVGVARPSAQGQAITSTATALMTATSHAPVASTQPTSVSSATPSTAGTKTALTRSTMRWIGALAACADSTMRITRASVVSAPTASVFTVSAPSAFTAPPVTRSPTPLATGMLSPVMSDSSTWLRPAVTSPSTATRSPGRTLTRSPTCTCSTGTSVSTPSRSTRAVAGRRAFRARMASAVWRLARASSHLPSTTRVMTAAEASKYRCGMPLPVWPNSR